MKRGLTKEQKQLIKIGALTKAFGMTIVFLACALLMTYLAITSIFGIILVTSFVTDGKQTHMILSFTADNTTTDMFKADSDFACEEWNEKTTPVRTGLHARALVQKCAVRGMRT